QCHCVAHQGPKTLQQNDTRTWLVSHLPNDDIDMLARHLVDLAMSVLFEKTFDNTAIVSTTRCGEGLILRRAEVTDGECSKCSRRGFWAHRNLIWHLAKLDCVGSHELAGPRQARQGGPLAVPAEIVAHASVSIAKRMNIFQPDYTTSAHESAFSSSS